MTDPGPTPLPTAAQPSKGKSIAFAVFFAVLTLFFLLGGLALLFTPRDRWGGVGLLALSVVTGLFCWLWLWLLARRGRPIRPARDRSGLVRWAGFGIGLLVALAGAGMALDDAPILWALTALGLVFGVWCLTIKPTHTSTEPGTATTSWAAGHPRDRPGPYER